MAASPFLFPLCRRFFLVGPEVSEPGSVQTKDSWKSSKRTSEELVCIVPSSRMPQLPNSNVFCSVELLVFAHPQPRRAPKNCQESSFLWYCKVCPKQSSGAMDLLCFLLVLNHCFVVPSIQYLQIAHIYIFDFYKNVLASISYFILVRVKSLKVNQIFWQELVSSFTQSFTTVIPQDITMSFRCQ